MYHVPDAIHEPLYVITPVFNAPRYKVRYKNYHRFARYIKDSGAILVTVEAAFGERAFAIEEECEVSSHPKNTGRNHIHIRVRTSHELWTKENLINIALSRLPADWKYVAWIDSDVVFSRPNWVGETIHQLQHYQMVQMFSHVLDLDPDHQPLTTHQSFMYCYLNGIEKRANHGGYYDGHSGAGGAIWHPGFAWAARREAIDALGCLVDWAILGAGDNHMAHALIGRVHESHHQKIHPNYRKMLAEWQYRADTHIRRNVGYVSGLILHYWHGKKADRRYWDRWKILVDNRYDPEQDIKYDSQGLLQLVDRQTPRSIALRDQIRKYFRERREDSIDV